MEGTIIKESNGKPPKPKMVYKTTLKKDFGFTDALIKELGEPDKLVPNSHHRTGPKAELFLLERAEKFKAERLNDFGNAQARKEQSKLNRINAAKARMDRLADKYGSPENALGDAAEAMFSLNRYAKYDKCSGAHCDEIYSLKNGLVKLLYDKGLAVSVKVHAQSREGLECWGCDGSGFDEDGEECQRCDGTGMFRNPDSLKFVCFRFLIGDKHFCWHQPKRLINWKFKTTDEAEGPMPDTNFEKPISLRPSEFAQAKDLIRYALGASTARPLDNATASVTLSTQMDSPP